MANFYKQTDDGEYVEADKDVDALFRQKSDEIVKAKLHKARERESAKIREELEAEVRESVESTVRDELKQTLSAEYEQKLAASESKVKELDVALRRKTIAAEYGFKADAEQFLGDGSDDDMRAKADTLKASFGSNDTTTKVEKKTTTTDSSSFVKLAE